MTELPLEDATATFDCKVDGCEGTARRNRGPTAYLCDLHARQRTSARLSALPGPAVPPARVTPPGDSFEAKAKTLVQVGRRLDRAIVQYKPAKSTLDDAMREWRASVATLAGDAQH